MEDAFIAIVEEARRNAAEGDGRQRGVSRPPPAPDSRRARKLRRIAALVRRRASQVLRDPSSIAIGIVMPVMLILLFGYGLSLDVKNVPVAVVLEDASPDACDARRRLRVVAVLRRRGRDLHAGRRGSSCRRGRSTASSASRPTSSRRLARGNAEVQILVQRHGRQHRRASSRATRRGPSASGRRSARPRARRAGRGPVVVQSRLWFNEANDSHYFLVPGLIVLVMTLIGAFLTALVMAREWERGTLEALFVTPGARRRDPARQDRSPTSCWA